MCALDSVPSACPHSVSPLCSLNSVPSVCHLCALSSLHNVPFVCPAQCSLCVPSMFPPLHNDLLGCMLPLVTCTVISKSMTTMGGLLLTHYDSQLWSHVQQWARLPTMVACNNGRAPNFTLKKFVFVGIMSNAHRFSFQV
jgi:hypothetical protein